MRWLASVMVLSFLLGCGDDPSGNPRQPPTPDDLEFTDLFIDNQSGGDVVVFWDAGDGLQTSAVISAGTRAQFAEASQNFQSPTPAEALDYLEVTDGSLPIHRQSPVSSALWTTAQVGDRLEATLVVDASTVGLDTGIPAGSCCCEFMDLDIVTEDLRTTEQCPMETNGVCIVVQAARITPNPCCPDSTGETCYPAE
jgi:hypothetical protein